MKLGAPYELIGSISNELVDESLSLIKTEHWEVDKTRNRMDNLTQTESIILRYFDNYESSFSKNWKEKIVNKKMYSVYENVIEKILVELKKNYHIENYMAFFAKLKPRGVVGMHVDSGSFLESCHRIHIPLKTNEKVFYIIEDQKYNWTKGNIYEFDNTRIHGVVNESDEERIHLMFNIFSN